MKPPKLPPHNLMAEKGVLGSVLRSENSLAHCHFLRPDDFYVAVHGYIWQAVQDLVSNGKRVDAASVGDLMGRRGQVEDLGPEGLMYLATLYDDYATTHVRQSADIIQDKAIKRRASRLGREIADDADADHCPARDVIDAGMAKLLGVATGILGAEVVEGPAIAARVEAELCRRRQMHGRDEERVGFPWDDFNQKTNGLHGGELTILAARPGVGKTTAALNIVRHNLAGGKKVFFASLEMSVEEIGIKMVCMNSRIGQWKARTGNLSTEDTIAVSDAQMHIERSGWSIDDNPGQSVFSIASKARMQKLKNRGALDLIVVDYLQLVQPADRKEKRHEQVGQVTRGLKFLARELDVPVLAACQLNRDSDGQKPRLSQLRESGSIEQDADTVILVHRPEEAPRADNRERLECNIAKQRHGPIGEIILWHEKEHGLMYEEQRQNAGWP